MLQNAYLLAKIGADTAENEQHFAERKDRDPAYWEARVTYARGYHWYLPTTGRRTQGSGTLERSVLRGGDVRERRLAKFRQNVARFRLYRLRFLQENMRFAAFFKIYQILKLKFLKFDKILQILRHLQFFC